MNSNITQNEIKKINPYAIFVATGGGNIIPNFSGVTRDSVVTVTEVLKGQVDIENKNVAIIRK